MTSVDELIQQRPGAELIRAADLDNAVQLTDFIFMSTGTSNAYMVTTPEGRVIINTGMGFEALTHKKLFDAQSTVATSHIILTQAHVDHVGGVGHFKEAQTQVIAQANNPACQADDERIAPLRQSQSYIWFDHVIDQAMEVAKDHPEVFIQDKPQADILFDEAYQFSVGGVDFELIATPGGETRDSAVVWLPQHKILFSGNVFGPLFPHFPNFNTIRGDKYRFPENYLDSLSVIKALKPEVLITGHGDPIYGEQLIQDSLERLYSAVSYVLTETLEGMNNGQDCFELMKTITLPKHLTVGEGYGKVNWAVRTIWEQYIGWFHQQSTTELYGVQVREVYSDLVDLAGVEALLTKAEAYQQGQQWLKALHLLDIILADDPRHGQAIVLSIDIHQHLLQEAQHNFWLRGWLSHRIQQLQQVDS